MGTRFYFLYLLVVIGLYLSVTILGILNISYGEFTCESNEDLADNCKKIPIMLDTETPNTPTD
jgi:hypothetical protein